MFGWTENCGWYGRGGTDEMNLEAPLGQFFSRVRSHNSAFSTVRPTAAWSGRLPSKCETIIRSGRQPLSFQYHFPDDMVIRLQRGVSEPYVFPFYKMAFILGHPG
jgi:hypothetical protein